MRCRCGQTADISCSSAIREDLTDGARILEISTESTELWTIRNWIIGHTDRFHAAASQRSISNWVSFEHNSDIGHTFILNNQGANTRTDVELLWKQSPLQFAPNCKTPTLFIHSDEDYRCYMAEGLAMFSAIKRNGCPSKLCLFHGENHELSRGGKPENRIDRMTEIIKWMDEYLK